MFCILSGVHEAELIVVASDLVEVEVGLLLLLLLLLRILDDFMANGFVEMAEGERSLVL